MKRRILIDSKCAAGLSGRWTARLFFVCIFVSFDFIGFVLPNLAGTNELLPLATVKSDLLLDNKALHYVPVDDICGNASLTRKSGGQINKLSLANNKIRNLESAQFKCVADSLKVLDLDGNLIEKIHSDAFQELQEVQVLSLSNNKLNEIPSASILSPLRSMTHLNLDHNNIVKLGSNSFGLSTSGASRLISLDLRANPIQQIEDNSLAALSNLQTLTLSKLSSFQGEFHGNSLKGLHKLRTLYLDRSNLSQVDLFGLCHQSPDLSSLVVSSNRLAAIPNLEACTSLLALDLSYNHIGAHLDANFSNQHNLIDLYLHHNRIELIGELAFVGLYRLQRLDLRSNNIKRIHPQSFAPIQHTLYRLNIANNINLRTFPISAQSLHNLAVFISNDNPGIRVLPHFESATHLRLTYAYHCCSYRGASVDGDDEITSNPAIATNSNSNSAFVGIFGLMLRKLASIIQDSDNYKQAADDDGFAAPAPASAESDVDADIEALHSGASGGKSDNKLTSLWLKNSASTNSSESSNYEPQSRLVNFHNTKRLKRRLDVAKEDDNDDDEEEDARQEAQEPADSTANGHHSIRRLIDELVSDVRLIRLRNKATQSCANENSSHKLSPIGCSSEAAPSDRRATELDTFGDASPSFQSKDEFKIDFVAQILLRDDDDQSRPTAEFNKDECKLQDDDNNKPHLASRGQPADRLRTRRKISNQLDTTRLREVQCYPQSSSFLPCVDLFDTWWLRTGIWAVCLLGFSGNTLVIIVLYSARSNSDSALTSIMGLAHSKRYIDVPRFLIINLAFADLLMSLYLGILASVDLATLGNFKKFAIQWQYSKGCKFAGFLAVLSSELSVFTLAILTLERNYAILNAVHLNRRLSLRKALLIMSVGYVFALGMATIPLTGVSDYSKSSICLPLDIDSKQSPRIYLMTLIGINAFSFILLLICYLKIYCATRGSPSGNTNDMRIVKRMSVLILADFLCWSPIILVATVSLFGYQIIGVQGLKVLTIFVLPLNSISNPFLYAITTKKFKRDLKTLRRRISSVATLLNCPVIKADNETVVSESNIRTNTNNLRLQNTKQQWANINTHSTVARRKLTRARTTDGLLMTRSNTLQTSRIQEPKIVLETAEVVDSIKPCVAMYQNPMEWSSSFHFPSEPKSIESCPLDATDLNSSQIVVTSHCDGSRQVFSSEIFKCSANSSQDQESPTRGSISHSLGFGICKNLAYKSCQAILPDISLNESRGYRKLLNVTTNIPDDMARPASACNYDEAVKVARKRSTVDDCNVTRSLNKLLMNPIKKTWSDLQRRVNSNLTSH